MDTLGFDVESLFVNALMSFQGTLKMIGGKDCFDIMQKGVQSFSELCSRYLPGSFLHTLKIF